MQKYRVIGMMSGTSVDGLDIAYCEISTDKWEKADFSLLASRMIPYPENFKRSLIESISLPGQQLTYLDIELGEWIGDQLVSFISDNAISRCLVASHGHTVFHQPEKKFTLQIGNGQVIHRKTGFPVIYDFRVLDVCYGGQGAPLVPIGDELLFSEYDFCLNLGGFANVSYNNGKRRAFDIGAVNIVLNELTSIIHSPYDENGNIARGGNLIHNLNEELHQIPFYNTPPPKSIGKEWVEQKVMPVINKFIKNNPVEDIISTFTTHTGEIIAKTIYNLCTENKLDPTVFTCGGGSHNSFLLEVIASNLPGGQMVKPDSKIIDFKEAIVFGLMGVLRSLGLPNCLMSVTGASKDTSGGIIIGEL